MTAPSGLGVFVWELPLCEGGDPQRMADKARGAGVTWIAVKAGDHSLNGQLNPVRVKAWQDNGLYVAAWFYSVPGALQTAQNVDMAKALYDMGCQAVLVDAEEWWERGGDRRSEAADFANRLRTVAGDRFLADCGAWQWPSFHPRFPDAEFGSAFDARMPELYWTEFSAHTNCQEALDESDREWGKLPPVAKKCVMPIGSAFDGKQPCTLDDLRYFLDRYQLRKYNPVSALSLWSWQHMNAIASADKWDPWAMLAMRASYCGPIPGS